MRGARQPAIERLIARLKKAGFKVERTALE